MIEKIKGFLKSEKSMPVINIVFLLAIMSNSSGLMVIACAAWGAYLAYLIKATESKAVKIVAGVFILVAIVLGVGGLYCLLR